MTDLSEARLTPEVVKAWMISVVEENKSLRDALDEAERKAGQNFNWFDAARAAAANHKALAEAAERERDAAREAIVLMYEHLVDNHDGLCVDCDRIFREAGLNPALLVRR